MSLVEELQVDSFLVYMVRNNILSYIDVHVLWTYSLKGGSQRIIPGVIIFGSGLGMLHYLDDCFQFGNMYKLTMNSMDLLDLGMKFAFAKKDVQTDWSSKIEDLYLYQW